MSVSFSLLASFLAIIQLIQCAFLIFLVFAVFLAIFYVMHYLCLIFHDYPLSRHNPGLIFHFFLDLSPYSKYYIVHFSFFTFLLFLGTFQVQLYEFLIFLYGQISRHNSGPTVCFSQFSRFFSVSRHIPGQSVFEFHFPHF